jgi:hypothetical protein
MNGGCRGALDGGRKSEPSSSFVDMSAASRSQRASAERR